MRRRCVRQYWNDKIDIPSLLDVFSFTHIFEMPKIRSRLLQNYPFIVNGNQLKNNVQDNLSQFIQHSSCFGIYLKLSDIIALIISFYTTFTINQVQLTNQINN